MADQTQLAINDFPQKTPCVWYPKSKDPPKGLVWATDGVLVWLVYTEGKFPDGSYFVRAWTDACIPEPPKVLPT